MAEADAVNEMLARTGNTAQGVQGQVQGLNKAHQEQALALQTVNSFATSYGGSLTQQEAAYARLQLSTTEATVAERDFAAIGGDAARAMGAMGAEGARAVDRFSALGGAMTMGGPWGLAIGGALVGAGAMIEAGHSMIENADQNEAAQKSLEQAFTSQGRNLKDYQGSIDSFLHTNRDYISNQYEAKNAIAEIARSGADWQQTQRLMNDALDLSAAKHISLSEATKVLIDAENGRAMGLLDLGINIKSIEDPQKEIAKSTREVETATREHTRATQELQKWEDNHHERSTLTAADLITEQQLKDNVTGSTQKLTDAQSALALSHKELADKGDKNSQMLDQVEAKTDHARDTVSKLTIAHNELSASWDDLSNKAGPPLEDALAKILTGASDFVTFMDHIDWGPFKKGVQDDIITPLQDAAGWWNSMVEAINGGKNPNAPQTPQYTSSGHPSGRSTVTFNQQPAQPQTQVLVNVHVTTDPGVQARIANRAAQV
jgi:hypothetical protein